MGIARNAELIMAQMRFDGINIDGLEKTIELLLLIADDLVDKDGNFAKDTAVVNMSFGDRDQGTSTDKRRIQCGHLMSKSTICFMTPERIRANRNLSVSFNHECDAGQVRRCLRCCRRKHC
jgi:hypothetical protein